MEQKDKKSRNSRKKLDYEVNVGKLVAKHIAERKDLSYQIVADAMHMSKAALVQKVKQPYFGTSDTIAAASKVLGVNLFEPYLAWLKKEGIPSNDEYASMQLLLNEICEENALLKTELASLKKIYEELAKRL